MLQDEALKALKSVLGGKKIELEKLEKEIKKEEVGDGRGSGKRVVRQVVWWVRW